MHWQEYAKKYTKIFDNITEDNFDFLEHTNKLLNNKFIEVDPNILGEIFFIYEHKFCYGLETIMRSINTEKYYEFLNYLEIDNNLLIILKNKSTKIYKTETVNVHSFKKDLDTKYFMNPNDAFKYLEHKKNDLMLENSFCVNEYAQKHFLLYIDDKSDTDYDNFKLTNFDMNVIDRIENDLSPKDYSWGPYGNATSMTPRPQLMLSSESKYETCAWLKTVELEMITKDTVIEDMSKIDNEIKKLNKIYKNIVYHYYTTEHNNYN